jgi:membrane protein required for colicin V production
MPFSLLDIGLIAVMLVSGILAMVRGFMREVLSIAAWVIAAVVTLYGYARAVPYAKQYISNDLIATGVAVAALFLGTLLIVSLFTVKVSDLVLDSRVGALDRSLGFLFGLGRGLVIMVVAFLFFIWLVPAKSLPDWVKNARSRPVLQGTGDWLLSLLPDDPETAILKRLRRPKEGDEAAPQDAPPPGPGQRSDRGAPAQVAGGDTQAGYKRNDRQGFEQLLESTRGVTR